MCEEIVLSVQVIIIACVPCCTVSLHLLDFGEVYTCTLPNAYGRLVVYSFMGINEYL